MELTPRLQAIADQVPQNAHFADIGTDHGYLPIWLLLQKRVSHAIAADLREGPLDRARETARQYRMTEQIDFCLCDGLTGIEPEDADVIAIAGMGGETIAAILEAAPWTRESKLLLLQPMTSFPELRSWLQKHRYAIEKEKIVCEGKRLYSIMTVRGGEMPKLTAAELWAGRQSDDPLRGAYLDWISTKVQRALSGHRAASMPDQATIKELEAVLTGLGQMKEELT